MENGHDVRSKNTNMRTHMEVADNIAGSLLRIKMIPNSIFMRPTRQEIITVKYFEIRLCDISISIYH